MLSGRLESDGKEAFIGSDTHGAGSLSGTITNHHHQHHHHHHHHQQQQQRSLSSSCRGKRSYRRPVLLDKQVPTAGPTSQRSLQVDGPATGKTHSKQLRVAFTARCYACAVLAMGLCLSVCLSVTSRCRTSSFCTVAWKLARFQLTRRIARSIGDS